MPDSVTNIGDYAFCGCSRLQDITISDSLVSIGDYTFEGCTGLTSASIGNSVNSIGGYAFYNCTALKTLFLPKNLFTVYSYAFYACTELTDVYYDATWSSRLYNIDFNDYNGPLQAAEWHYACSTCSYDNACDVACNNCWKTRTITHSYGEYVYNNDATYEKDGTKTHTCSVCGDKETVTAEGTKLTPTVITNPFNDVKEGKFYYDAVLWAVNNDVTTGTSANAFSPDNKCTRAQIVTFLWRAAGSPKATSTTAFTDIKEGSYYYDAVIWAVANGITTGITATTFSPNSTCTRGQIVTFLWRAKGQQKATIANPFKDTSSDAFYADAMLWAVENGITTGTSATTFSPNSACTRGQCVTFLYRSFN